MTSSTRISPKGASNGSAFTFSSVGIRPAPKKDFTDFSIKAIIGHVSSSAPATASAMAASANWRHSSATSSEPAQPRQQMDYWGATAAAAAMAAPDPLQPQQPPPPPPGGQQRARKLRPKNFQCSACKMAFSNNGQLKNHVRIHTGERPFRCKYQDCNKTFTRNEELTRHKLIHSGLRPHACGACGKRFGRKDHLKKHIKTHEITRVRRHRRRTRTPFMDPVTGTLTPPAITLSISRDGITTTSAHATSTTALTPTPADILLQQAARLDAIPEQSGHEQHYHPTAQPAIPIQQLANEYWHSWYNLFGLYQAGQYDDHLTALPTLYHNVVDDDDKTRRPC